jgi:predicted ATP-grasp superfamily ATP-dependent carboligase
MKKSHCSLVLGGYVNGYSIIQELYEKKATEIILFGYSRELASYSNKIKKFVLINKTPESLYQEIEKLHNEYEKIIVFPTDDLQLENLHKLHDKISSFCFLPFNPENLHACLDKRIQYSTCEKLGIPYPKTVFVQEKRDLKNIELIQFPVLLKPSKREDLKKKVFRNMKLESPEDLYQVREDLESYLAAGVKFLASEIIPGDGNCIYAYVAYRDMHGKILNEWTGRKLAQYPDNFGVFASASNEAPEEVMMQGRKLLDGMDIRGIAQPEFKYDFRDKKYKLMEINLRSMMWHRVGNLSGVNLQYAQYLDALGEKVSPQTQIKNKDIHFIYLKHEIINLIKRRKYSRTFIRNIRNSDKTYLAVYDRKDMKPFLKDCINMAGGMYGRFSRILRTSLYHKSQSIPLNFGFRRINRVSDHVEDPDNF